MSFMKAYLAIEDEYGTDIVQQAMAIASALPDDDAITPHVRFARIERLAAEGSGNAGLRDSLREVTACLAGDAGAHRDMLSTLKVRLERALA